MAITPREMQTEQANHVFDLICQVVLNGNNCRMSSPVGIGRTMIMTLACNRLIKEIGLDIVYASPHRVLVEQMREFGPDFPTMTFREFVQRDVQEVPCGVVIYESHHDVDFGDDIVAIRLT